MANLASQYRIIQVAEISDELYHACLNLIPQLTRNNPPPTRQELSLMLSRGTSTLFAAQYEDFGGQFVGLATLVLYRVPTGLRGIIEDVVVDERARGRGIGEALMRACLEHATEMSCPQVLLTSNPCRQAANRLYQRMGFKLRRTNGYKYDLKQG